MKKTYRDDRELGWRLARLGDMDGILDLHDMLLVLALHTAGILDPGDLGIQIREEVLLRHEVRSRFFRGSKTGLRHVPFLIRSRPVVLLLVVMTLATIL